jgi:hypothetical protein
MDAGLFNGRSGSDQGFFKIIMLITGTKISCLRIVVI